MPEDATTLPELGRLIGRVEKSVDENFRTVHATLGDHGQRITALEEARIRSEERASAEERLKAELDRRDLERETRKQEKEQEERGRVTLTLYRWQVALAVIALVLAVVVPIVLAFVHHN